MSRYPDRPSCPCASCVRKRARKTELVGALYDLRREKGRCINHPTRKAHRVKDREPYRIDIVGKDGSTISIVEQMDGGFHVSTSHFRTMVIEPRSQLDPDQGGAVMAACTYHLPSNRECPYPSLYEVTWRPHRIRPAERLARIVCVAHLAPAIDQALGDSARGETVEVRLVSP